jgi:hypothetical protein
MDYFWACSVIFIHFTCLFSWFVILFLFCYCSLLFFIPVSDVVCINLVLLEFTANISCLQKTNGHFLISTMMTFLGALNMKSMVKSLVTRNSIISKKTYSQFQFPGVILGAYNWFYLWLEGPSFTSWFPTRTENGSWAWWYTSVIPALTS